MSNDSKEIIRDSSTYPRIPMENIKEIECKFEEIRSRFSISSMQQMRNHLFKTSPDSPKRQDAVRGIASSILKEKGILSEYAKDYSKMNVEELREECKTLISTLLLMHGVLLVQSNKARSYSGIINKIVGIEGFVKVVESVALHELTVSEGLSTEDFNELCMENESSGVS